MTDGQNDLGTTALAIGAFGTAAFGGVCGWPCNCQDFQYSQRQSTRDNGASLILSRSKDRDNRPRNPDTDRKEFG